ncbi:DUF1769-domain-containing protein [Morchella conica CCBAS932]|uniref:DUF1769-domain-containing protein n=1 Tax=Morchella conica CCBAS932 TaxID=1392247 RepID=A0A3N4KSK1_9PEZI|nr:DUF1769-domain-containing protein [Morchella conica CCBAS932]
MSAANFRLRVTAGPTYDRATHTLVPVNTSTPLTITTPTSTTTLHIRFSSYKSPPSQPLPSTHPYFTHPTHAKAKDLYSFQLLFTPTAADISGADLVWGNDFDRPIRDLLPFGFSVFWNIGKWIDPGLEGDLYADKPWVWGSVLSSMNVIAVASPGTATPQETEISDVVQTEMHPPPPTEPGAGWSGDTVLEEDMSASTTPAGIPSAAGARKKFFLERGRREGFVFRRGWRYGFDFFGPWLDFAGFEIRLPGYALDLLKYWDGQPVRPIFTIIEELLYPSVQCSSVLIHLAETLCMSNLILVVVVITALPYPFLTTTFAPDLHGLSGIYLPDDSPPVQEPNNSRTASKYPRKCTYMYAVYVHEWCPSRKLFEFSERLLHIDDWARVKFIIAHQTLIAKTH